MRRASLAALAAVLLASPATAQLGAATQSPPPEGVAQGQGAAFPKGQYAALDALPDWGGSWFAMFQRGAEDTAPAQPKLKGEFKAEREKWLADARANDGVVRRTRSNCSPPGMPRIMRLGQYPYEFIIAPGRVHDPDHDPSFMGDSIGRWEGDTLVVETTGINGELEIDTGIPHSDNFRLTERIHLDPNDPDVLVNEMTMVDPDALEEPFKVTQRYRRDRYGKLIEFQCAENDRNPIDAEGFTVYE